MHHQRGLSNSTLQQLIFRALLTMIKSYTYQNLVARILVMLLWIGYVEFVFKYKNYGNPKRVLLTATKVKKGAMHWWHNLQQQRVHQGLPKNTLLT